MLNLGLGLGITRGRAAGPAIGDYIANGFTPDMALVPQDGFYYSAGPANFDTITGGTFVRASDATFTDGTGTLGTAGSNAARVSHYLSDGSGGFSKAGMLDEDGVTNTIPNPEDLTDVGDWTQANVSVSGGSDSFFNIQATGTFATLTQAAPTSVTPGDTNILFMDVDLSQTTASHITMIAGGDVGSVRVVFNTATLGVQTGGATSTAVDAYSYEIGPNIRRLVLVYTVGIGVSTTAFTHWVGQFDGGDHTPGIISARRPMHVENSQVPSSYIPNTGTPTARASDDLRIPAAVMAKAMADKAGSAELVDDPDFTIGGLWIDGAGWVSGGGTAVHSAGNSSNLTQAAGLPTTTGAHVLLEYTVSASNVSGTLSARLGDNTVSQTIPNSVGDHSVVLDMTGTGGGLRIRASSGLDITLTRFSVREVTMPAAISIAVEGYMTYADEDKDEQSVAVQWQVTNGFDEIVQRLRTIGGFGTGAFETFQYSSGTPTLVASAGDTYSPGVNVPFSWASRHGATFINGAHEGTLLTADLTPTALADLVTADFEIASTGNFIISKVLIWFDDIGDAGLVEATS